MQREVLPRDYVTAGPVNDCRECDAAVKERARVSGCDDAAAVSGSRELRFWKTQPGDSIMRSVVLLVSCLFLALPASAQQVCSDFELVGFTSTTHLGDVGVLGATLACQDDYIDSRMCTSVEVMNTVNVPLGLTGSAWVRPVFVPPAMNGGSSVQHAMSSTDASGAIAPDDTRARSYNLSCSGWGTSSSLRTGLSVDSTGAFGVSNECENLLSVACCAAPPSPAMAAILPFSSSLARMMMVVLMLGVAGIYWTRRTVVV